MATRKSAYEPKGSRVPIRPGAPNKLVAVAIQIPLVFLTLRRAGKPVGKLPVPEMIGSRRSR